MHAIKWHGKFSDPREPEEGQQMHQMHSNFADLHFFYVCNFYPFLYPKRIHQWNNTGSLSSLDMFSKRAPGEKMGSWWLLHFYQTIRRKAWKSKVFPGSPFFPFDEVAQSKPTSPTQSLWEANFLGTTNNQTKTQQQSPTIKYSVPPHYKYS